MLFGIGAIRGVYSHFILKLLISYNDTLRFSARIISYTLPLEMEISDSSSEDECNIYVNAASKLNGIKLISYIIYYSKNHLLKTYLLI